MAELATISEKKSAVSPAALRDGRTRKSTSDLQNSPRVVNAPESQQEKGSPDSDAFHAEKLMQSTLSPPEAIQPKEERPKETPEKKESITEPQVKVVQEDKTPSAPLASENEKSDALDPGEKIKAKTEEKSIDKAAVEKKEKELKKDTEEKKETASPEQGAVTGAGSGGASLSPSSAVAPGATPTNTTTDAGTGTKPPAEAVQENKVEGKNKAATDASGEIPQAGGADAGGEKPRVIKIPFPDVKKDLDKASSHVCGEAAEKTTVLKDNEQTHFSAAEKQTQTDQSIVPPGDEAQAKGDAGKIDQMSDEEKPKASEETARSKLDSAVDDAVPKTMGDLSDFKSKGKAKAIGRDVTAVVTKDVSQVEGTFGQIKSAAPPLKDPKVPLAIPEVEMAPVTANMNLGKDAVPGLQAAHTDFEAFDQESDNTLKSEGITDAELDMVDSGELLEARNERKKIKTDTKNEPSKLKGYATGQEQEVEKNLQKEESESKSKLNSQRKDQLGKTQGKQKTTKTAIELKRQAVTDHIKGIHKLAKESIEKKLKSLEEESMKRFDREQEKFSNEFENEVNDDINAWKKERYSGAFGWFKKGKDWLLGIDDFPEVKAAFKKGKDNFVKKIDNLIVAITKDNKTAIDECKKILQDARTKIKVYVSKLGPDVADAGKAAMKEMEKELDKLDKFIDEESKKLKEKLCSKKEEAIKAIDKKIEKMKEAMSGALNKLVNLLVGAMLKFFKWVLAKFGMDQGALMGVIEKGAATIKKIVMHPIDFIMNLVRGVGMGIKNFGTNIKKHLLTGVVEWLTGSLGGIGLTLPEVWDLKGVMYLVLQILGLTWQSIRAKLVKEVGEEKVAMAEKTVDIIKRIIVEGPMALWEMIKEKAAEIKQSVMEGIRNWLITNMIKQGLIMLASFLSPAGAIIQAIKTIYNVIMWFIDNWSRLVEFVKTVFSAITDIAFGRLGAVAAAAERGLAMLIPMVLDFLAKLLNLGGITKAVKNVIKKIRKPIDKIVTKLIKTVVKKVKQLFGKGKKMVKKGIDKGKDVASSMFAWLKAKKTVMSGGKKRTVYFDGGKKNAKLKIKSSPGVSYSQFLGAIKESDLAKPEQKTALKSAKTLGVKIEKAITSHKNTKDQSDQLVTDLNKMADLIAKINPTSDSPPSIIKYGPVTAKQGGTRAEAKILTANSGGSVGSEPADEPPIWTAVQKRKSDDFKRAYVQGHLLNHNVHGPGKRFNMTPITYTANAEHKVGVEKEVKERVLDKKQIVYYQVKATYGTHPESPDFAALKGKGASRTLDENNQFAVMSADRDLATKFSFTLKHLEPQPNGKYKETVLPFSDVQNVIPKKAPTDIPPAPIVAVSLSSAADAAAIAAVEGIDMALASKIIQARNERENKRFHTYDNLKTKLSESEITHIKELADEGRVKLR